MKITIIYDNDVWKEGLKADWGFSCLVEIENTPKILFDTGANGSILLSNMKKMNIDPKSIDEIFISHPHFDHVGGLSALLDINNNVKVYAPASFRGVHGVKEVVHVSGPLKIHENVLSTGEIDNIEQSMVIKTDKGIVLVVGCSHPEMSHIFTAASQFGKIYGIIGGLHGFNKFDLFKDLEFICPTHCTQHKAEIKKIYPEKCIDGGAGQVIEI